MNANLKSIVNISAPLCMLLLVTFACTNIPSAILEGDFRPPLVITSVIASSPETVLVEFKQDLDPATIDNLRFYSITSSSDTALPVTQAVMGDEANSLVLTTGTQTPNETYTLVVLGTLGKHELPTPHGGTTMDFMGYVPESLSVLSVQPISANKIKIKFGDDLLWETADQKEQYVIYDGDGELVSVFGVFQPDGDSGNAVYLSTGTQIANTEYSLLIFGVQDVNGKCVPPEGLLVGFTGFDPILDARTFTIVADSLIHVDEPFSVTVTAMNQATGQIVQDYFGTVEWSIEGKGELTSIEGEGWKNGIQKFTMVYHYVLSPGQKETFILEAQDSESSDFIGTSNLINGQFPIQITHFQVDAPYGAVKGEPFDVTITAINNDSTVNEEYDGAVYLSHFGGTGSLNLSSVNGFENGSVTSS